MNLKLTDNTKKYLLSEARRAVASKLNIEYVNKYTPDEPEKLNEEFGAFVTIHKNSRLRGCIGYIVAVAPIIESVRSLALESAFHDPRFNPLSIEEYPSIRFEITVLSKLIRALPEEIVIGRDGLFISQGHKKGVLLPQVAVENEWDRTTFINQTCCKAGLPSTAWHESSTVIERFEGLIFAEKSKAD